MLQLNQICPVATLQMQQLQLFSSAVLHATLRCARQAGNLSTDNPQHHANG